ncbi:hypothetical protein V5O48_006298 [Marasmius crinis-equi]|uniref:WD40 repeat-like protein n=1 Tax=Marasmius crinis-equi TaxID=585013 RepID=A0ABR3FJV4_9AGAR
MATLPSSSGPFEVVGTLQGARDAVLSVKFSAQAKFISAAGELMLLFDEFSEFLLGRHEGYNGVNVWVLDTLLPVTLPRKGSVASKPKYIYTASTWIFYEHRGRHTFLLGSLEGDLIAWDWNEKRAVFESTRSIVSSGSPQQITSIDVSQPSFEGRARIAVGHANCRVSVWKLPPEGNFIKIFNVDLGFIPRTVSFDCQTNRVFVFAMTGGRLLQISSKSGKTKWTNNSVPPTMFVFTAWGFSIVPLSLLCRGSASLHSASERMAISSGQDIRVLQLPSCMHLATMEGPPPIVRFPKQVAFTGGGDLLVAGTDNGKAIVYDISSGKVFQSLPYTREGLVQSVATHVTGEICYIAVAGSATQQSSDVVIWSKNVKNVETVSSNAEHTSKTDVDNTHSMGSSSLKWFLLGFAIIASVFFSALCARYLEISLPAIGAVSGPRPSKTFEAFAETGSHGDWEPAHEIEREDMTGGSNADWHL